nr:unnamed protein product [Digitaria exilis]
MERRAPGTESVAGHSAGSWPIDQGWWPSSTALRNNALDCFLVSVVRSSHVGLALQSRLGPGHDRSLDPAPGMNSAHRGLSGRNVISTPGSNSTPSSNSDHYLEHVDAHHLADFKRGNLHLVDFPTGGPPPGLLWRRHAQGPAALPRQPRHECAPIHALWGAHRIHDQRILSTPNYNGYMVVFLEHVPDTNRARVITFRCEDGTCRTASQLISEVVLPPVNPPWIMLNDLFQLDGLEDDDNGVPTTELEEEGVSLGLATRQCASVQAARTGRKTSYVETYPFSSGVRRRYPPPPSRPAPSLPSRAATHPNPTPGRRRVPKRLLGSISLVPSSACTPRCFFTDSVDTSSFTVLALKQPATSSSHPISSSQPRPKSAQTAAYPPPEQGIRLCRYQWRWSGDGIILLGLSLVSLASHSGVNGEAGEGSMVVLASIFSEGAEMAEEFVVGGRKFSLNGELRSRGVGVWAVAPIDGKQTTSATPPTLVRSGELLPWRRADSSPPRPPASCYPGLPADFPPRRATPPATCRLSASASCSSGDACLPGDAKSLLRRVELILLYPSRRPCQTLRRRFTLRTGELQTVAVRVGILRPRRPPVDASRSKLRTGIRVKVAFSQRRTKSLTHEPTRRAANAAVLDMDPDAPPPLHPPVSPAGQQHASASQLSAGHMRRPASPGAGQAAAGAAAAWFGSYHVKKNAQGAPARQLQREKKTGLKNFDEDAGPWARRRGATLRPQRTRETRRELQTGVAFKNFD